MATTALCSCLVGDYQEDGNLIQKAIKVKGSIKKSKKEKEWQQALTYADSLKTPQNQEDEIMRIAKGNSRNLNVLIYLLEFGTKIPKRALACAVRKKNFAIVKILLKHNADPKQGDAFGCAIIVGNWKIVLLFLKNGADPNHFFQSFVYEGFVLGIALMKGYLDVMKLLLKWGADIKEGCVLGFATIGSDVAAKKIILQKLDGNNLQYQQKFDTTCYSGDKSTLYFSDAGFCHEDHSLKMKEITKKLGAKTNVVPRLSVSFPERTETEQLKITYDELNETKEKSCDEPNRCEKWTTDSIDAESAWDGGCQEMGGLLASKSEWIVNDEEELQIEAENFFRPERCTYFNKVMKRLETFLPVCSGIDCDSLADAGFYYTGENIRCFTCGVVIIFRPCTDDYWAEHAKTSPGCSYVRTQKGAAYIHHLLSTEVNSESHPDDVKGKRALLFETYLDPDGSRFYDTGTAQSARINTVLRGLFGCLELFPDQKFQKEKQRPSVIVGAKYLLKGINDARVQELRYLLSKEIRSKSTEVFEFIRLLGEQPRNRGEVHVFIVQNVMSRLSSYRVWPHRNIRTGPLVEAGFSCKEPQTCLVKCMSCGLELNASTLNDTTPLDYHRTQSPDCEFFNERNSPASDGHQIRTSNDLSTAQVLSSVANHQRATEYAAQTEPQNNLQSIDSQGQSRSGNKQEENDTPPQMPTVPNDGNIHVDEATLLNDGRQLQTENSFSLFSNSGAGVSEPLIAERPRTGQGFDRTALPAPDNNVTSRGEAVTENENVILGAEGNDNSFPIRNPRYTEENARRETFTHWPHRSSHDIDRLVNCGFFYTGAEDIVRCFYCDIGLAEWNPDDDPWVEHARHSPECPYLRAKKGQDYINNIQTQWARIYTPKHPQYSQVDARRRTFNNEAWPRDNVLQTPDQLAAAGFFYTGEGDTVRCHYCDGGLREWEPEDNPWVEHARWFPFCKFVLKIKGIDFIQASATGNPTANGLPTPAAQQVTEAPLTMSFVEACRIRERRNPLYSAAAQSIRTMGYSKSAIKMIIDLYIARTGRRDFNATHLMDIVMEMEDTGQQFPENDGEDDDEISMGAAGGNIANIVEEEMELSPAAMKKENEYLKVKFKCKVCERQERCIVFVPCGHRVTCQQCGERADVCIHCKSRIDQRYKTYLS